MQRQLAIVHGPKIPAWSLGGLALAAVLAGVGTPGPTNLGDEESAAELLRRANDQFAASAFADAEVTLRQAEQRADAESDPWVLAQARGILGGIVLRRGDVAGAESLLRAALTGLPGVAPPEALLHAQGLELSLRHTLVRVLLGAQRAVEAEGEAQTLIRCAEQCEEVSIQALAHALRGQALAATGRLEEADAAARCGVMLLGADAAFEQVAFDVYYTAGRRRAAVNRPVEAGELLERAVGAARNESSRIAALGHLTETLIHANRIGAARERLAELLEAMTARGGAAERDNAELLAAKLAFQVDDPVTARQLWSVRLEHAAAHGTAEQRANLRNDLALCSERLGDFEAAERDFRDALTECGEELPLARAKVHVNLGRVLSRLGRPDEALGSEQLARALAQEVGNRELEAIALSGIAAAELELGRRAEAEKDAADSIAMMVDAETNAATLSPLHTLARAALARGAPDEARALIERADRLVSALAESATWSLDAAGIRSRFAEYLELAADLGAVDAIDSNDDLARSWRTLDAIGAWKARTLLDRLPANAGASTAKTDFEGLRAALGNHSMLVEFAEGADELHAWVVDGTTVRHVALGPREPVALLALEYFEGLSTPHGWLPPERVESLGRELFEKLLAPVLAGAPQVERLVLSPPPRLALAPFEAFVIGARDPAPPQRGPRRLEFVLDRFEVTRVPSARIAARTREVTAPEGRRHTLLVGDPLYDDEIAEAVALRTLAPAARELKRLEHTSSEILAVARRLAVAAPDGGAETLRVLVEAESQRHFERRFADFTLLLGERATPSAVLALLPECGRIHIACHGHADLERAAGSALVLSPEPGNGGLLTVGDILQTSLDAPFVVLAGCGTGAGRVLPAEGPQSVASAFLCAGARAVIASTWSVVDADAAAVMRSFDQGLIERGESPAKALRAAVLRLRQSAGLRGRPVGERIIYMPADHPMNWATWVHHGMSR